MSPGQVSVCVSVRRSRVQSRQVHFDTQVELLGRWLDIRVWISGGEVKAGDRNLEIITVYEVFKAPRLEEITWRGSVAVKENGTKD